jgi:hypothetical protein
VSTKKINSDSLARHRKFEKCLSGFFKLFGNLCALCFEETVLQITEGGHRDKMQHWCCCLTDNQVHDNWDLLDAIHRLISGPGWYDLVKQRSEGWQSSIPKRRLPGNGCLIAHCRPITCTTHVCEKMIFVLVSAGLSNADFSKPLQIDEIVGLPNLFHILHNGDGKSVSTLAFEQRIRSIEALTKKLGEISPGRRNELAAMAIQRFLK